MPAAGGGVHGVEAGMALDEGAQLAPGEAESGFEQVRGGVAGKLDHNFALYRAGPLPKWSGVRYNLRKMAAHAFIAEPRIDPRCACFRLKLGRSGIHGWGGYAAERIPARQEVIEYTGGRIGGSGAELINPSCTPNLYSWVFKGHILYMSKRDIRPGEELTVDYHFSDKIDHVPCRCGSAQCRGTINIKTGRPSKS